MTKTIMSIGGTLFLLFSHFYSLTQSATFRFERVDSLSFTIDEADIPESISMSADYYCSDSLGMIFINLGWDEKSNKLNLLKLDLSKNQVRVLSKVVNLHEKAKKRQRDEILPSSRGSKYTVDTNNKSELYLIAGGKAWKTSLLNSGDLNPVPSNSEFYPFTYFSGENYVTVNYYKDILVSKEMQSAICIGNLKDGHLKCLNFNPGLINYSYFNNGRIVDFTSDYIAHGIFSEPMIYLRNHEGVVLDSCKVDHEWISWEDAVKAYDQNELNTKDVVDSYGKIILEKASKTNVVRFINDSTIIHSFMTTPNRVYETLLTIRNNKLIPVAKRGPVASFYDADTTISKDDFPLLTYYGKFFRNQLIYLTFTNSNIKGKVEGKCYFYNIILEEK